MVEKLKREFIKLLEEDKEFRYTVAGYLGLSEILKSLDELGKRMLEIEERFNKRLLEMEERFNERLLEMEERFNKRFLRLEERVVKLEEGHKRIWEEIEKLWEGQKEIREDIKRLYEGQERIWRELRGVRRTLDRLALTEEEEARSVIRHRLKEDMGVDVELDRVFIDDKEINVYGATEDLCIIGEVSVRAGAKLVEELEERIELLKRRRPELLRPKLIKAFYTLYATPDAVEKAKELGIWLLKWDKDYTPKIVHRLS